MDGTTLNVRNLVRFERSKFKWNALCIIELVCNYKMNYTADFFSKFNWVNT